MSNCSCCREQNLAVKLRKFTLRVVWGSVITGATSSAVSRHDNFIFREIENDDCPVLDLGVGSVRKECGDRDKKLSHMAVSLLPKSIRIFIY